MRNKDWETAYTTYMNLCDSVYALAPTGKYAKMKKQLVIEQLENVGKQLQFVLTYEKLKP